MNDMMSIVFASGNESKLNELTLHRTTASLPFGGRYRLIDFTLSNLVNSGVTTIGIITRNNYSSLMDHIRMGRDWDLNRKNSGIAVFPPFVVNTSREVYKGKIEAIYTILDYLERAREEYVIISNSNIAANIDFEDIYEKHLEQGADITVVCHKGFTTTSRRVILNVDAEKEVKDAYITETTSNDEKLISLNTYLLKKDLLMSLIENAYARGFIDFEKDILFKQIGISKISAYEILEYAAIVEDVKSYFSASMKLLDFNIREQLFRDDRQIYTKVKDSVPTVYHDKARVTNSLIADGCEVNGTVENSILFRNVKIEEGAIVKNSIVMENTYIQKNSVLTYAITDKDVTIRENRNISGFVTYPIVIVKGKIV